MQESATLLELDDKRNPYMLYPLNECQIDFSSFQLSFIVILCDFKTSR